MSQTSIPQIYIPRVHTSYTWQDMKAVFDELLGEGCVKRVDIVKIKPRREGDKPPPFNRAYVHIKKWPEELNETRDALKSGETINLYPDDKGGARQAQGQAGLRAACWSICQDSCHRW
ncbi:MAG: hypothetical protein ACYSOT_06555 [Planctomycetota bacterium]